MKSKPMTFSRRLIIGMTPIGMAIGLMEGWRLAGGLVAIIAFQMILLGCAAAAVVMKIREEKSK